VRQGLKGVCVMRLGAFKRVNMGLNRHLILQSPTEPNAHLKIDQETFFTKLLATTVCTRRL
jgi:hypothetical protein